MYLQLRWTSSSFLALKCRTPHTQFIASVEVVKLSRTTYKLAEDNMVSGISKTSYGTILTIKTETVKYELTQGTL